MKRMLNLLIALIAITSITASSCFRHKSADEQTSFNTDGGPRFKLRNVDDLYKFLTYTDRRVPLVSAHRGGPTANYPENSIETFQRIASRMPAIIECDIALTKDSALVLMHDETLDRTTTGKGKVNHHTLKEIKTLYLEDNDGKSTKYRVPTLQEALVWGAGKAIFTLDVKKNVPYQLVIDAIRKANAEAFSIIITYSASQAAVVYNLAPELMISASIKNIEDLVRLNDRDVPDTRIVAFIGTRQPDNKLTTFLHEHGILCILGTIGNLDRQAEQRGDQVYADYIEEGADILSTDRPLQVGKIINYYTNKRNLSSPYLE